MILNFSKLLGLFLELIEFVKTFGLDFFECVKLAGGQVDSLVDFSIFLARAKDLKFFEIRFPEHLIFLLSYN